MVLSDQAFHQSGVVEKRFDIVGFLQENLQARFPRVGSSYAELTVLRRQREAVAGEEFRHDLALAQWFGGDAPSAQAEEVWGEDWVRRMFDAAFHADELVAPAVTRYTAPLVYLALKGQNVRGSYNFGRGR